MMWQPIETAPKDGTLILVAAAAGEMSLAAWSNRTRGPGISGFKQGPGFVAWADGNEVPDEGWDEGYGFSLELSPVYWMTLPPPPINPQSA